MSKWTTRAMAVTAIAGVIAAGGPALAADAVADFYKDKTVTVLVGGSAGGGYDIAARAVARHLGRHIPGQPTIVVKNMPGSVSLNMTNHLYNRSARDGTVIGVPNNGMPIEPKLKIVSKDGSNIKFDANKLQWIGSPVQEPFVAWFRSDAPAQTIDAMKKTEMIVGATSPGGDNSTMFRLLNALIGTKFKVVTGYPGQGEIFQAVERGELHGNGTGLSNLMVSRRDWIRDKKINILIQYGIERDPLIPNVPTALDILTKDEDRKLLQPYLMKYKMTRPLAMPPEVPQERVDAVRAAFDATMKDPTFLADAKRIRLNISPIGGAAMQELVREIQATPQPIIDRLRKLLLAR